MPRGGQAMTLLCHIVGESLGWALVQSPLQTSSRPAGTSSGARGAIATPLLRIGGVPGGCLQRVRVPPLLSLPFSAAT